MQRNQSKQLRLLLVGLGAVALLAVLLLWTTLTRRTPETTALSSVPTAASAARAEMQAVVLPASDESKRDQRESAGSALAAANASVPAEVPAETLEVLVIDRANNEPVADAKVDYWAYTEAEERKVESWKWSTSCELETHMQKDSETSRTDTEGKASVKKPKHGALVLARAGELWGYGFLRHDSEKPWRLELDREESLSVLVVDARGMPVGGAIVVLHVRSGESSLDETAAPTREADGVAILPNPVQFMCQNSGHLTAASVALGGVFEKTVEVALDPAHLPKEPVRLVMPAFGACEVLVVEPDGEPCQDEHVVRLRQITPDEKAHGVSPQPDDSRFMIISEHGRALFRHVTPGLELIATVSSGTQSNHFALGPGPAAAGLTARITVRLGETLAIVRGRVVDANGRPLKKYKFRAWVEGGKEEVTGGDFNFGVEPDDEGRFHVDLRPRTPADGVCALVLIAYDEHYIAIQSASRELPATLTAGVHDLGDFTLVPTPTLASGRVVDGNDKPVREASVYVSIENADRSAWEHVWTLRAESDAEGRFVLRGRLKADTLAISARDQSRRTDSVLVERGATDIVLVMRAPGEIVGRVLLDPWLSNTAVQVFPEKFDGDLSSPGPLGEDGSFALQGLPPGVYTVKLREEGTNRALRAVERVRVDSGATTRDPRLDPLDARTGLAAITLTIVDADGQSVMHGSISRDVNNSQLGVNPVKFENGKAVLTHDGSGLDVVISSTGFRDARLEKVREDRTVTLRGAPRVKLVLADGQRPPEKPFGLGVRLEPTGLDASSGRSTHEHVYFDAQGRLFVFAPDAGRMKLRFRLSCKPLDEDKWSDTYLAPGGELFIDVRDVEGEQVFEVTCDATALSEAIERLRKGNR